MSQRYTPSRTSRWGSPPSEVVESTSGLVESTSGLVDSTHSLYECVSLTISGE